jgi:hypothetical protein
MMTRTLDEIKTLLRNFDYPVPLGKNLDGKETFKTCILDEYAIEDLAKYINLYIK